MKRIIGIVAVSVICIALGLSVDWYKERDVSLVQSREECIKATKML